MKYYLMLVFLYVMMVSPGFSQQANPGDINPDIIHKRWPAYWIACPGEPDREFGIYYFRKTFNLDGIPRKFIIHVSADNRYRLYVNGKSVSTGPARGDLQHWRFESLDISAWLIPGKNVLAAVVWNFGEDAPNAQMWRRTAFIVTGNSPAEAMVITGNSWLSVQDSSRTPIRGFNNLLHEYTVVGPGEKIDGAKYIWNWEQPGFDDSGWKNAVTINYGMPRTLGTNGDWMLVPREIPFMEEKDQRLSAVRLAEGIQVSGNFLQGMQPVTIPPHSQARLILDQGFLTTAYPVIGVSGGKQAEIKVVYAESMYNQDGSKGNRNEINGKNFIGNYDQFIPDGHPGRIFSTLWFRTFRYIQLEIKTSTDPLILNDISCRFTAYPFTLNAGFHSNDATLDRVWETGWRTARLCAGETYYDCPYYEQMQYVGDTRIQALISLYVSGDDRLMRNALELFDNSRIPDGLTQSRYPSEAMQVIPPYSLFWIAMIYDYWMHRDDPEFVQEFLPGIRNVLEWFEHRIGPNGMLGKLEWWNFVDWTDQWAWDPAVEIGGVPDGVSVGSSSILTLQYAYALQLAASLEKAYHDDSLSQKYLALAGSLTKSTYAHCWDPGRKLLADTPDKKSFSQHANIFGILTSVFPGEQEPDIMNRVLQDKSLIQATLYFRFYLFRALEKSGMANLYLQNLGPWYDMLANGLTTFAEKPDPTRSDCHAWSASPDYDLLATVCGIKPGSPGFKNVVIQPNPGTLTDIECTVPHPLGPIHVKFKINGKKLNAVIDLPQGLDGIFIWNGMKQPLKSGRQEISF